MKDDTKNEISITINKSEFGIIKTIISAEIDNLKALSDTTKAVLKAPAYKELKKLNDKLIEFA